MESKLVNQSILNKRLALTFRKKLDYFSSEIAGIIALSLIAFIGINLLVFCDISANSIFIYLSFFCFFLFSLIYSIYCKIKDMRLITIKYDLNCDPEILIKEIALNNGWVFFKENDMPIIKAGYEYIYILYKGGQLFITSIIFRRSLEYLLIKAVKKRDNNLKKVLYYFDNS